MNNILKFPDGFLWGAATSAHQVEGDNRNDWTEWEKEHAPKLAQNAAKRQKIERIAKGNQKDFLLAAEAFQKENYISGAACDHYRRFREDFDLAKAMGHNAHRFSIEWSRIEPEEGRFDKKEIEHYREVIKALRERNIEPFVTLWHWTIPLWLRMKGGILAKEFPAYFERYAEKISRALEEEVRYWIILNEPTIYALNGYLRGVWPPGKRGIISYFRCITKLTRAHRHSYKALKMIRPDFKIGIAANLTYFQSAGGVANNLSKKILDEIWNYYFLNRAKKTLDFIGLNYYFRSRIDYGINKNPNLEVSDLGWDVFPEGIYHVLKNLQKYGKPIYITENGIADASDDKRPKFILNNLKWVYRAIAEGADIRGYFYWSLLDNFEWDKGFWPRFGLIEIDYKTYERKRRLSSFIYEKIAKSNTIKIPD